MSGALRVAMIVANDYEVDARVRRQAEALARRRDRVSVISLGESGHSQRLWIEDVDVIKLAVDKYRGDSAAAYLSYYARFAARAAIALAKLGRQDLIQVHSMPEALAFCALPQRLTGVPVLLDIHDLTSKLFETKFHRGPVVSTLRLVERASMAFASTTMTVHEPYARMLRRQFGRVAGDVPIVINVPDGSRWQSRDWRQWGDEVVFSFHGSLVHRYGVLDMVDALAKVRNEMPGARLLVRGDGDARDDMVVRIQELGLSDSVDLSPGYIPLERMPQELEPAHIGLAPYHFDPFMADSLPTKLLEYAIMGVPVVSARLPYIEELFGDSLWFIEPGDTAALADAMLDVVRNPDSARRKAEKAAAVVASLSWEKQRDAYLAVVDGLARRRTGRFGQNNV